MITGRVTEDLGGWMPIDLSGPTGQVVATDALIDTGFDGSLSLPASLIDELNLTWLQRGRAILADGNETLFDMYEATIIWDGESRRIIVDEAETAPLVGMRLLAGHEVMIRVQVGGRITISALS